MSSNVLCQELCNSLCNGLCKLLTQPKIPQRLPKTYSNSWEQAQHDTKNTTAGIFLQHGGFRAWFAYYLAKNEAEIATHFRGKSKRKELVEALDKQSIAARQLLAAQVAAQLEPDVVNSIDQLCNKQKRQDDTMPQQQSNKRRAIGSSFNQVSAEVAMPSPTMTPGGEGEAPSSVGTDVMVTSPSDPSSCLAENQHVLAHASLTAATRLLPAYLAGAIRRIPDPGNEEALVAGISMMFPDAAFTGKFGCTMTLEVAEHKIQHIAKELFDADLETHAGLRYIWLSGRTKVLPNPSVTLRGCRRNMLTHMFGSELSAAIAAGPVYMEDVKQGHDYTDSVWMMISYQATERGLIYMSLGLREGSLLEGRLFS